MRLDVFDAVGKESKIQDLTVPSVLVKETTFAYIFAPGSCRILRAEMRDPLRHLTVIDYNGNGMPAKITDANSNATTIGYHPVYTTKPASITDPLGNTVRYTYDALGRRISVTDAKGATTTFGYDGVTDRIGGVTDANGKITRYS